MQRAATLSVYLLLLPSAARAQERSNEASIGFQQYYLSNGSSTIANVSGLTLGYRQFIPDVGILSISLAPAASDGRFQTGDSFVELKGLPWVGNYWTLRGGDFRLPGRLLEVPFNNLYYPEISGRGVSVEATHGKRTIGFLYGRETLQAGVRVPLRLVAPQTMAGGYLRQKIGDRLHLGARLLRLTTDLQELQKTPFLATTKGQFSQATSATVDGLYTITGRLKWYAEAALSGGSRQATPGTQQGRYSTTTGPLLETERITVRANYLYQTDSYLPLLGYYLGDRRGPYAEVKLRPFSRMEFYGSASDYSNNVSRHPDQTTIRSKASTAGVSFQLPARFSFSGQFSTIKLASREKDNAPWETATSEQVQLTLAKQVQRHSLRFAVREFQQLNRFGLERQRAAEAEDVFQFKWFSLGAAVRAQRMIGRESKTSIFVRGNGQFNLKRFSAYAYVENGNDLANRTLFATSTVSSTVLGTALRLGSGWDLQAEAFRNNLIAELNPQNIFVLQGQGVFVPAILSTLNQWSLYFRMTKRFSWGKPVPVNPGTSGFSTAQIVLKGTVEGFVTKAQNRPLEGIPVTLDGETTTFTGTDGRFVFEAVSEGARKVGLSMEKLPADFDPGITTEVTVLVRPGKRVRVDLDVKALGELHGSVVAPRGLRLESVVLKLLPTGRYTTPDSKGLFSFYNVHEGTYQVELVESTLPPLSGLTSPRTIPVSVEAGNNLDRPRFEIESREIQKPVRKLVLPAFDPLQP
jgi:hypothetical protein